MVSTECDYTVIGLIVFSCQLVKFIYLIYPSCHVHVRYLVCKQMAITEWVNISLKLLRSLEIPNLIEKNWTKKKGRKWEKLGKSCRHRDWKSTWNSCHGDSLVLANCVFSICLAMEGTAAEWCKCDTLIHLTVVGRIAGGFHSNCRIPRKHQASSCFPHRQEEVSMSLCRFSKQLLFFF